MFFKKIIFNTLLHNSSQLQTVNLRKKLTFNVILKYYNEVLLQYFSTKRNYTVAVKNEPNEEQKSEKKGTEKKKPDSEKITLINLDGSKTCLFLNQAQKKASHKGLNLVEIDSEKKIYKTAKVSYSLNENIKSNTSKRNTKKMVIKSNIESHDMQIKVKQILAFLEKGSEVIVHVQNKAIDKKKSEDVCNSVITSIGPGYKIYGKYKGASHLGFIVTPEVSEGGKKS